MSAAWVCLAKMSRTHHVSKDERRGQREQRGVDQSSANLKWDNRKFNQ